MNDYLEDTGRKISEMASDSQEGSIIFQRPCPPVIHPARRSGPLAIPHSLLIFFFVFDPWTYTTGGIKSIKVPELSP